MARAHQKAVTPDGTTFQIVWNNDQRVIEMTPPSGSPRRLQTRDVRWLKLRGGLLQVQVGSGVFLGPIVYLDPNTGHEAEAPPDLDRDLSNEPMLGELADVCPSCRVSLAKRPKRKTKCKACGASIYAKRRPQDDAVVLCTEAVRDTIEEQWSIAQGYSGRPEYNVAKKADARLDVEDALEAKDWSLFSTGLHSLAEIAYREGLWPEMFELTSKIIFLKLTGASSDAYYIDPLQRSPDTLIHACGLDHGVI